VKPLRRWIGLFAGLSVGFACGQRQAFAQETPTPPSNDALVFVPDSASLDRIHTALATAPALRLAGPPQFYASVVFKPPILADDMKGWDLRLSRTVPPSGVHGSAGVAGVDLLQLVGWAIQSHRDREVRQIRERIDQELRALTGAR
jgi:hypothetical protein